MDDLPWRDTCLSSDQDFPVWGTFWFDPPINWLMHSAKFQKNAAICRYMGRLMAYRPGPPQGLQPVVCPIPLRWQKQARRGFNQSLLLADVLASAMNWRLEAGWLRKVGDRPAQKLLDRASRLALPASAFHAVEAVRGRTILLVDDICTTGSTLAAARRCLLSHGAAQVYAWVCAVVR